MAGSVMEPRDWSAAGEAIARSVLFASLFDYPLTLAQLRQTLIESAQTPSQIRATYAASAGLRALVEWRDGLLFPRNRPDLPDLRRQREEASRAFLARHRRYLRLACRLPFVRMVALSGSVAHLNLDKGGDLDLFVVTRGRHAWSVTVALVVLAKLMRRRRVVCANFVMADTRLGFEPQDLFTASQLIHLRPLIGGDMHQSLLAANPFVYRFYPNAHVPSAAGPPGDARAVSRRIVEALLAAPARLLEHVCRIGYRRYLHARSGQWTSPEQVCLDDDRLKLHTRSHRQSVLDRFDYLVREAIGGQARPAEGGQGQTAAISARTPALVPAPEVLGRVRSRAEQPA